LQAPGGSKNADNAPAKMVVMQQGSGNRITEKGYPEAQRLERRKNESERTNTNKAQAKSGSKMPIKIAAPDATPTISNDKGHDNEAFRLKNPILEEAPDMERTQLFPYSVVFILRPIFEYVSSRAFCILVMCIADIAFFRQQ
jgi:hypothetical protein